MYTTIEPRLIALPDNDGQVYTSLPSLDLPPLQHDPNLSLLHHDPNVQRASPGRPLLLEPDAGRLNSEPSPNSIISAPLQGLLLPDDTDDVIFMGSATLLNPLSPPLDRVLGNSSPQSLSQMLQRAADNCPSAPSKKRHMSQASKDDFVQLPKPHKKQKAAKQVVPPIIIGLFEPPPQAALFPPIDLSSFDDVNGLNTLNMPPPKFRELEGVLGDGHLRDETDNEVIEVVVPKKMNEVRPRKRWTEEETNQLLLGVSKHGIGNWTAIIEDNMFSFNERSGLDLKDRFRTCCPQELRGKPPVSVPRPEQMMKATPGVVPENTPTDDNQDGFCSAGSDAGSDKPGKKRSHRKNMDDLAVLGIGNPFPWTIRRERRAYSERDDREILEGFETHGNAWARIQRDSRFHLQDRLPTDLRDRIRNKYPEKFREKGKGKDAQVQTTTSIPQSSTEPQLPYPPNIEQMNAIKKPFFPWPPPPPPPKVQTQEEHERAKNAFRPSVYSSMYRPPSRDTSRIEEIIKTTLITPKNPATHPQASLESFKDHFTFQTLPTEQSSTEQPSTEQPSTEQPSIESDPMPFSQSFDWGGAGATPFTTAMADPEIPRILLGDPWTDMPAPSSSAKGKQPDFYGY